MNSVNSEKKRVLVFSDEPRVLAEIKMELMDMFDVSIAATVGAVIKAMETYKTDLVVVYIGEGNNKAMSVFADVMEIAKSKGVPFMFLAEKGSDDDETSAFAVGAEDYTVRRRGTLDALCSRINLRIQANECEKRIPCDESGAKSEGISLEDALIGKTILVVDDVDLNREVIDAMLVEVNGLALDFAGDGKEAVEKFANAPGLYSLILMDVQMPVMDGIQATKVIRGLGCENSHEVPIIALTADADEGEAAKYLKSGMNGFLQKPMAYEQLISVLMKHCL